MSFDLIDTETFGPIGGAKGKVQETNPLFIDGEHEPRMSTEKFSVNDGIYSTCIFRS